MEEGNKSLEIDVDVYNFLESLNGKIQFNVENLLSTSSYEIQNLQRILNKLEEMELLTYIVRERRAVLKLTSEGDTVLTSGLPELQLLNEIKQKKDKGVKIAEVINSLFPDKRAFNAALGQLKKHAIVVIDKGVIRLDKEVSDSSFEKSCHLLQDTLKRIKTTNVSPSDLSNSEESTAMSILLERGLIIEDDYPYQIAELKMAPEKILEFNVAKGKLTSYLTFELLKRDKWLEHDFKSYNFTAKPQPINIGKKHPYLSFLDNLKEQLIGFGFQEMRGPLVELELWNFDALFQAQDHPARDWSDVYRTNIKTRGEIGTQEYIDKIALAHENGWETGSRGWRYKWSPEKAAELILRAQGTSISARTLVDLEYPCKYFSVARCYRPDVIDSTHLPEFNQVEGIVAGEGLNFSNLLSILGDFATKVAGAESYEFHPDFFPFTSPSVELVAVHPELGKIEFGGAGVFRPEVTEPFGIDVPVLAWGLGVDRLFMVKQGINDIRKLFSADLDWLYSTKVI